MGDEIYIPGEEGVEEGREVEEEKRLDMSGEEGEEVDEEKADIKLCAAVASDSTIMKSMKEGEIYISNFNRIQLSSSSYDVLLGENYCTEIEYGRNSEKFKRMEKNYYNPYSSKPNELWSEIKKCRQISDMKEGKKLGLKVGDRYILLEPGESILGHTEEFIGAFKNYTTMMKAKSTLGRSNILVCACAGWGDVGYVNRWTLEIRNLSQYHTIVLVVGQPIAQLVFFYVGNVENSYQGKYSDAMKSQNIEEWSRGWKPEYMYPISKRLKIESSGHAKKTYNLL